MIHPTAVISESATIGENVTIGPFCVVDDNVTIGDGCILKSHVVVRGPTRIGKNNKFYQFSSIGEDCQDKKYAGEPTELVIGDDNEFREGGNRSPRHYSRQQHYYYRLSLFIYGQLSCCP